MQYARSHTYNDFEEVKTVSLDNIIDPTLLRALGIIKNEDDVATYFINGQNTVNLMIKFKKKGTEVIANYGSQL